MVFSPDQMVCQAAERRAQRKPGASNLKKIPCEPFFSINSLESVDTGCCASWNVFLNPIYVIFLSSVWSWGKKIRTYHFDLAGDILWHFMYLMIFLRDCRYGEVCNGRQRCEVDSSVSIKENLGIDFLKGVIDRSRRIKKRWAVRDAFVS